jgi:hypothetical protein
MPVKGERALALRISLHASDLGSGWRKAAAISGSDVQPDDCIATGDLRNATIVATIFSNPAEVANLQGGISGATVWLFRAQAQAQAAYARLLRVEPLVCRRAAKATYSAGGRTHVRLSAGRAVLERIEVTAPGQHDLTTDVLVIQRGRALQVVSHLAPAAELGGDATLVRRLAQRMAPAGG